MMSRCQKPVRNRNKNVSTREYDGRENEGN